MFRGLPFCSFAIVFQTLHSFLKPSLPQILDGSELFILKKYLKAKVEMKAETFCSKIQYFVFSKKLYFLNISSLISKWIALCCFDKMVKAAMPQKIFNWFSIFPLLQVTEFWFLLKYNYVVKCFYLTNLNNRYLIINFHCWLIQEQIFKGESQWLLFKLTMRLSCNKFFI